MKKCVTCKEIKDFNNFHKSVSKKDGHGAECKTCKSIYDKNRPYIKRKLTPEQYSKKLARQAKYREEKRALKPQRIKKTAEEILARKRLFRNTYRKINLVDKIANRLRLRIKKVLKNNIPSNKKSDTRSYFSSNVGCKGTELIKHIESQFKSGMSWDNYGWGSGKWVIDHIRPIVDFIKCGEDPRLANHYSNLQPLWFDDNTAKGAKYEPEK